MARESQLQEQLLLGDHQAADAVSRFQEQIRQAHSAQAAAEGEVQTLNLRIKQLELQLQRQSENLSSQSEAWSSALKKLEMTVTENQMRAQHTKIQHDQEIQQQQQQLHQMQAAKSAADDRAQMLLKQIEQLQEQLLLGDRQAADAVSRCQEQIRQAHSAQAAAEGEVQTLNLRIKQLELQLQRQAAASVESRAQVDSLEIRLTEMNRTHGEVQQQLMSASLELAAFRQKAAELQAAAERTYVMWYSHALYHAHHTYDARM
jgi:chromosome segregation ATPase